MAFQSLKSVKNHSTDIFIGVLKSSDFVALIQSLFTVHSQKLKNIYSNIPTLFHSS